MGAWRNRLRQASRLATATSISAHGPTPGMGDRRKGTWAPRRLGGFNSQLCRSSSDPLGKSLLLSETQLFLPSNERVRPTAAKTFKF